MKKNNKIFFFQVFTLFTFIFITIISVHAVEATNSDCSDGTCVQSTSTTGIAQACIDTDGGLVPEVRGEVTGIINPELDDEIQSVTNLGDVCTYNGGLIGRCKGSGCKIAEYYCDDNYVNIKEKECEIGCLDGACLVKPEVNTVTIETKESLESWYQNAYWKCYDGTYSKEGGESSCKSPKTWKKYAIEFCEGKCSSEDSEKCGVLDFEISNPCQGESIIEESICGNGICESGGGEQCYIPETASCEIGKECQIPPSTCKTACPQDCSQNKEIVAQLNEKFKLEMSQTATFSDYPQLQIKFNDLFIPSCEEESEDSEAIEEESSVSIEEYFTVTGRSIDDNSNEAIEDSDEAEDTLENSACTDSDNGRSFYKKGTTKGIDGGTQRNAEYTDVCMQNGFVSDCVGYGCRVGEYFCGGDNIGIDIGQCPNGCKDGACVRDGRPSCTKEPYAILQVKDSSEKERTEVIKIKIGEKQKVFDATISFLDYDKEYKSGIFVVYAEDQFECPENCKCDINNQKVECWEIQDCEEGKQLCQDGVCREKCEITSTDTECKFGCIYKDRCLPIGVRSSGLFCSIEGSMKTQLPAEDLCDNNFECSTNLCIDNSCISQGAWKNFISRFAKFFGGKE